jgi:hypothetical protein
MDFDWETWSGLARFDPEAFERRRRDAIEALIASVPAHKRAALDALQCRIELERRRSSSSLGACVRLSNLMWRRFVELQQALDALTRQGTSGSAMPARRPSGARIFAFPAQQ